VGLAEGGHFEDGPEGAEHGFASRGKMSASFLLVQISIAFNPFVFSGLTDRNLFGGRSGTKP
jgi:hypothetical protein